MQYFNLALWVGPESETKLVHLLCDCSDLMVLPTSVVVSQRCCKHQHNLTETSTATNLVLLEKVETTYIPSKLWKLEFENKAMVECECSFPSLWLQMHGEKTVERTLYTSCVAIIAQKHKNNNEDYIATQCKPCLGTLKWQCHVSCTFDTFNLLDTAGAAVVMHQYGIFWWLWWWIAANTNSNAIQLCSHFEPLSTITAIFLTIIIQICTSNIMVRKLAVKL